MRKMALIVAFLAAPATADAFPRPPDPVPVDGGPAIRWRLRAGLMDFGRIDSEYNLTSRGGAIVECVLDKNARPANCTTVRETAPPFGKVAAETAALYRAYTHDASGAPTPGRRVRYAVGFGGWGDF